MDMLNFGKYFSLLLKTITESINLNLNFVAIILLVQPAYIAFCFYVFGIKDIGFHTLGRSTISNLNILFGNFSYEVYHNSNSVLGPIFFFSYLFTVNLILVNLFLALIYQSYINENLAYNPLYNPL